MAELFKNIYNQNFFDDLSITLQEIIPDFDKSAFLEDVYSDAWANKEYKQRMRHITIVLKKHLSEDFDQNAAYVLKIIQHLQDRGIREESVGYMFFPDFIELYGMEHYHTSVKAFEQITQFTSCEFGVRPFIIRYQDDMVEQMLLWSKHEHSTVRRLATEGCRSRLPWAMAIPAFKKDPTPIIPILENLKDDESETVRRSVANNLNDISKDNPNTVIQLAKKWKGISKEVDWVVKHACRTLLKQGNREVMELFGFGDIDEIAITDFKVHTLEVEIGKYLEFSFKLTNEGNSPAKIRLEYGLYYQKANGTLSRKVFKISEKQYPAKSTTEIVRKQPFKIITTRKLYAGLHQVSLIINGHESKKLDFKLI